MTLRSLEAVYEHGVLRPLEELDLPERQRVRVIITDIASEPPMAVSCYDLAVQAGLIGALHDVPADLSTNPDYLRGFGE